jgi:hypothetical protein
MPCGTLILLGLSSVHDPLNPSIYAFVMTTETFVFFLVPPSTSLALGFDLLWNFDILNQSISLACVEGFLVCYGTCSFLLVIWFFFSTAILREKYFLFIQIRAEVQPQINSYLNWCDVCHGMALIQVNIRKTFSLV